MNHSIPVMGDTRVIFQPDRYCLLVISGFQNISPLAFRSRAKWFPAWWKTWFSAFQVQTNDINPFPGILYHLKFLLFNYFAHYTSCLKYVWVKKKVLSEQVVYLRYGACRQHKIINFKIIKPYLKKLLYLFTIF